LKSWNVVHSLEEDFCIVLSLECMWLILTLILGVVLGCHSSLFERLFVPDFTSECRSYPWWTAFRSRFILGMSFIPLMNDFSFQIYSRNVVHTLDERLFVPDLFSECRSYPWFPWWSWFSSIRNPILNFIALMKFISHALSNFFELHPPRWSSFSNSRNPILIFIPLMKFILMPSKSHFELHHPNEVHFYHSLSHLNLHRHNPTLSLQQYKRSIHYECPRTHLPCPYTSIFNPVPSVCAFL